LKILVDKITSRKWEGGGALEEYIRAPFLLSKYPLIHILNPLLPLVATLWYILNYWVHLVELWPFLSKIFNLNVFRSISNFVIVIFQAFFEGHWGPFKAWLLSSYLLIFELICWFWVFFWEICTNPKATPLCTLAMPLRRVFRVELWGFVLTCYVFFGLH